MADPRDDWTDVERGIFSMSQPTPEQRRRFRSIYRQKLENLAASCLDGSSPLSKCPDFMENIAAAGEAFDRSEKRRG